MWNDSPVPFDPPRALLLSQIRREQFNIGSADPGTSSVSHSSCRVPSAAFTEGAQGASVPTNHIALRKHTMAPTRSCRTPPLCCSAFPASASRAAQRRLARSRQAPTADRLANCCFVEPAVVLASRATGILSQTR